MAHPRNTHPSGLLRPGAALALFLAAACSGASPTASTPADGQAQEARKSALPGAPRSVVAVAGDAQATVSWSAPYSDGGRTLLSYRVTALPGGATLTVAAPATSAVVRGLANGTAYTLTVVATNSAGDGPASASSAAVTPQGAVAPPPPPPPPATSQRWVAGFYVGYQRSLYPVAEIDFSLMSHIVIGRIIPTTTGGVLTHFDINDVDGPAMARAVSTRAHQAGKKAMLMLGGSGTHAQFVGAASLSYRELFVTNLLTTMDALGYDGIDVDWEPIHEADKAPLLWLLQQLRARRPGMLITLPVGMVNNNSPGTVDAWYGQAAAVVDRVNLMSYGMGGAWQGWEVWHHSPLHDAAYARPMSVASTVDRYLSVGVPAGKLGIGLGFYGTCWKGATQPRVAQTTTTARVGNDNNMSYSHIMSSYYEGAARRWDAAAGVPYLTFSTPKGPNACNFISYEDEQSIAAKGEFVRARGLGGAIVWTIAEGHLPSAPAGSRDPLLAAAARAFLAP